MTIRTTTDKAAVVDTAIKWIPVYLSQPPAGAKCLTINRHFGTARIDTWTPKSDATHWHPLPTWKEPMCTYNCNQGKDCTCIDVTDEQIKRWADDDGRLDLEDMLTIGSVIALAVVTVLWLVYVVGGWL